MSAERRKAILEYLSAKGFATAEELASSMGTSAVTIRRDLAQMSRDELIARVHGGAKLHESARFGLPFSWRLERNADRKKAIAARAAQMITNGDTVLIDAGSTCRYLAEAIPGDLTLRAITHSVENVSALASKPNIEVICPGGKFDRRLGAFVGPQTDQAMAQFHGNVSFLAAAHVNVEQGLVNNHVAERAVKRIIHDHAEKCYLLADSTKFGIRGFQSTLTMDEFEGTIITDSDLSPDQAAAFRERGVELVIA